MVTLKGYCQEADHSVRLLPLNRDHDPIVLGPDQEFKVVRAWDAS
jgi:hypothetical protein